MPFKLTLHKTDGTEQIVKCQNEHSLELEMEVANKRHDVVGVDLDWEED